MLAFASLLDAPQRACFDASRPALGTGVPVDVRYTGADLRERQRKEREEAAFSSAIQAANARAQRSQRERTPPPPHADLSALDALLSAAPDASRSGSLAIPSEPGLRSVERAASAAPALC